MTELLKETKERFQSDWRNILFSVLLTAVGTLAFAYIAVGSTMVSRAEMTTEMQRLRDSIDNLDSSVRVFSTDLSAVDRRLSRIEGRLQER